MIKFVETCGACPEQYEVFDEKGVQIAYVRLRFGTLRVDIPDCGGETILTKHFDDEWKGCFDDQYERDKWLSLIEKLILGW